VVVSKTGQQAGRAQRTVADSIGVEAGKPLLTASEPDFGRQLHYRR
jgi:hypothetical protein